MAWQRSPAPEFRSPRNLMQPRGIRTNELRSSSKVGEANRWWVRSDRKTSAGDPI
jgi:hypothetical protein